MYSTRQQSDKALMNRLCPRSLVSLRGALVSLLHKKSRKFLRLDIDQDSSTWRRVMDINDLFLRKCPSERGLENGDREYKAGDPITADDLGVAAWRYGASGVEYSVQAEKQIEMYSKEGFSALPICMAKTHYLFSHIPSEKGATVGFVLPIRDVGASIGAGFIPTTNEMWDPDPQVMPGGFGAESEIATPPNPGLHYSTVDSGRQNLGYSSIEEKTREKTSTIMLDPAGDDPPLLWVAGEVDSVNRTADGGVCCFELRDDHGGATLHVLRAVGVWKMGDLV
ncbi:hypothetical protein HHK36_032798 [Tetracentron sinense]|uniref:Uncharacterized protein n=1 Tax=Tetracentron sinense TaxID=13715 RepID=A0A835CXB2_TETSI|nr:hypothetical protein HHK36_032798 [Tetracentron sinense]